MPPGARIGADKGEEEAEAEEGDQTSVEEPEVCRYAIGLGWLSLNFFFKFVVGPSADFKSWTV